MHDSLQIRLSGAGGQGLITAGVILAEAALMDGKEVVQTQMYGPSARLGASRAEVLISDHEIAYPEVTDLDLLLCMSQEALETYIPQTNGDTKILVDTSTTEVETAQYDYSDQILGIPITGVAKRLGHRVVANVVALGVLNSTAQIVSVENLRVAVGRRVPERFREVNERALDVGQQIDPLSEDGASSTVLQDVHVG